jgi:HD-like signal output (HDOD) protein
VLSQPEPIGERRAPIQRASHFLDQIDDLPSLPAVYLRVKACLERDESSLDEIAHEISLDPAITARLLRIANSPINGMSRKISTPMQAVAIVGLAQIQHLVLATAVTSTFAHIAPPLMDMQRFWHESLYRAVAARALAREARLGQWERLFVSGLLSDIGHLILYLVVPLESEIALSRAVSEPVSREDMERMMLGFDHTDISGALARKWQLPEAICHCLEYQMRPLASDAHAADVCAVHVAARLARWVMDDPDAPPPLDSIPPALWQILQVAPENLEALRERMDVEFKTLSEAMFAHRSATQH